MVAGKRDGLSTVAAPGKAWPAAGPADTPSEKAPLKSEAARGNAEKQVQQTTLCPHQPKGGWHYGEDCAAAQPPAEILGTPDRHEASLRQAQQEGGCSGADGKLAHGEEGLRSPGRKRAPRIRNEKVKCRQGSRRSAHGPPELRSAAQVPQWVEPGAWEASRAGRGDGTATGGLSASVPEWGVPMKVPVLGDAPQDQLPGPAAPRAPRAQERAPAPRANMVQELKDSLRAQWQEATAAKAKTRAREAAAPPDADLQRLSEHVKALNLQCAQLQQQMQQQMQAMATQCSQLGFGESAAAPFGASGPFASGGAVVARRPPKDQVVAAVLAGPPGLCGRGLGVPDGEQ